MKKFNSLYQNNLNNFNYWLKEFILEKEETMIIKCLCGNEFKLALNGMACSLALLEENYYGQCKQCKKIWDITITEEQ